METKHTPEPWRIYSDHSDDPACIGTHIMALGDEGEETYIVCEWIDNDDDARLIAAAPDQIAELIRIEARVAASMPTKHDDLTAASVTFTGADLAKLRAIIAKATGAEQPHA